MMERLHPLAQKRGVPRPPPRSLKKTPKVARACERCRELRKRCDGLRPCESCQGLNIECKYSGVDGRKKEDWKARVEALEQRNAYLEQIVQQQGLLRPDGTAAAFVQAPGQEDQSQSQSEDQTPRNNNNEVESGSSSSRTYRSTQQSTQHSTRQSTRQSTPPDDQDLQRLFYAATASHPLVGRLGRQIQYGRPCENRRDRLPDEATTRRAVAAFFQCAATLFYVTTERKSSQLLDKVFHTNDATAQDVCEVAACAAIGCHYKIDEIFDEARAAFFYLASASLSEAFEASHIQGMRIFILLCMSCIMDKSSNARLLIMSALNLVRADMDARLQSATSDVTSDDEYRRTLQTLIFLEGWLSFSLGYRNCLRKNETDLVHCTVALDMDSNSEALLTRLIQSYMTRLVLVASEIPAEMAECRDSSFWIHEDMLAGQLDQWHQALPPELHLAALSSVDRTLTIHQEKALYLMHMMYIDSRLQLYCRLLKAFQNCTGEPSPQPSVYLLESLFNQLPKHMCETYTAFAIQLARIASLLYGQEVVMTRCWLVICAVFDACIVLLFEICRKYFTDSISSFTGLPAHVHTCLTVLRFCSSNDIAAHRLVDMLEPILELWNCLESTSQVQQEGQMRIEYILDEGSAGIFTVVRMTYQLLDLLPQTRSNVWV